MHNYSSITELMSKWDWITFFQSASNLGKQFNDRTWRFLKAEVLGIALEMASNGEAVYVDGHWVEVLIYAAVVAATASFKYLGAHLN